MDLISLGVRSIHYLASLWWLLFWFDRKVVLDFLMFITVGIWGIGLATRTCNLQKAPLGTDAESWVMRHDGTLYHNGQEKAKINNTVQEGDILVCFCTFCDHNTISVWNKLIACWAHFMNNLNTAGVDLAVFKWQWYNLIKTCIGLFPTSVDALWLRHWLYRSYFVT